MKPLAFALIASLPLIANAESPAETQHRICSVCHSSDVVTSMRQTKAGWRDIVQDMVARGAKANDAEVEIIVNYLARNYGKPAAAPVAPPKPSTEPAATTANWLPANAPMARARLYAHTGKLLWTFHTVPRPDEPGNETWPENSWKQRSGTNVWGLMTSGIPTRTSRAPSRHSVSWLR